MFWSSYVFPPDQRSNKKRHAYRFVYLWCLFELHTGSFEVLFYFGNQFYSLSFAALPIILIKLWTWPWERVRSTVLFLVGDPHKPSVRIVVRRPRAVSSAGPGWGCGLPATLKADSPRNNATASIYLASRPSSSACCGAASFHTHTHTVASAENLYNTGQRRDSPDYPRCRRIRTIESGLRSRFHSVLFVVEVTFAQKKSADCSVEHLLCPLRFSPFLSCQLSIYTRRIRPKFASFPRLKPNLDRVLFTRNLFILSYRNGWLVLNDSYIPFWITVFGY